MVLMVSVSAKEETESLSVCQSKRTTGRHAVWSWQLRRKERSD